MPGAEAPFDTYKRWAQKIFKEEPKRLGGKLTATQSATSMLINFAEGKPWSDGNLNSATLNGRNLTFVECHAANTLVGLLIAECATPVRIWRVLVDPAYRRGQPSAPSPSMMRQLAIHLIAEQRPCDFVLANGECVIDHLEQWKHIFKQVRGYDAKRHFEKNSIDSTARSNLSPTFHIRAL